MERSRRSSQLIAYVLTWANGLLLMPGLVFACFGAMLLLSPNDRGMPIEPTTIVRQRQMSAAIVAAVFLAGSMLLWGYWRHARGKAVPGGSLLLWLLTIVYNAPPIVLFWLTRSLNQLDMSSLLILLWPLTTIILALVAIGFDLRKHAHSRA